jgi:LPXTG-motif cell wall-anchored protein
MITLLDSDPRRGSGDDENEDWLVLLALAALTLAALIAVRRISGRQR